MALASLPQIRKIFCTKKKIRYKEFVVCLKYLFEKKIRNCLIRKTHKINFVRLVEVGNFTTVLGDWEACARLALRLSHALIAPEWGVAGGESTLELLSDRSQKADLASGLPGTES